MFTVSSVRELPSRHLVSVVLTKAVSISSLTSTHLLALQYDVRKLNSIDKYDVKQSIYPIPVYL